VATIATRLRNFLRAQATVNTYTGDRIFETKPPQTKVDPYIVLRRVSTENADVFNGNVGDPPLFYGIAVECVSRQEWAANAVADAVRAALHLYRSTFDDTTAKGIFVDSESLTFERFNDASDDGMFTHTLDTRIALA